MILIQEPITTVSFIKMGVMLFLGAVGGNFGCKQKNKNSVEMFLRPSVVETKYLCYNKRIDYGMEVFFMKHVKTLNKANLNGKRR